MSYETEYGEVRVLSEAEIFAATVERMQAAVAEGPTRTIALTGGSTPKKFYAWAASEKPFSAGFLSKARWFTSDERMVPATSEESNFGVAERGMLGPLGVADGARFPWATTLDPHSAASAYNMRWTERFGADRCFDLCLLGMGDDGHTASIFPGSPLIGVYFPENFTCVEVPERGWRLTITRAGLERCREIVITVTGANKAKVLREVLTGPADVYPVQMLRELAAKTIWLVDDAAAADWRATKNGSAA